MVGIKDFGMPDCCSDCGLWHYDRDDEPICNISYEDIFDFKKRNDNCPLVEIPEPNNCVSNEELRQILQEIKNDCSERRDCQGCKFDMYDGCALCEIPDEWKLDKIGLAESGET